MVIAGTGFGGVWHDRSDYAAQYSNDEVEPSNEKVSLNWLADKSKTLQQFICQGMLRGSNDSSANERVSCLWLWRRPIQELDWKDNPVSPYIILYIYHNYTI